MIRVQPLLFALALGAIAITGWGQQPPGWLVYQASDGLPESACRYVSIGGAGDVFIQTLNTKEIARFDGYTWTNVPGFLPADSFGRVYESPAGQLWMVSAQGLCEWIDGVWRRHPVAEIAERHRVAPDALIPLCPVRQNVVIFLLPDKLMEFAAETGGRPSIRPLKLASQTGLAQFTGMCGGEDDGLWISGALGVAKIPGPKRMIDQKSTWREFICDPALGAHDLREPQRSDDDSVTCVANSQMQTNRICVRFDGRDWSAAPGDRFQVVPSIAPGAILDVAIGAHGLSWFATSDGLFCRVPEPWQPELHPPSKLFSSNEVSLTAQNGDYWTKTNSGIALFHEHRWTTFAQSDPTSPGIPVAFIEMPEGKIWCATREKIWGFDGRNWTQIRAGLGRINAMIRASEGGVWVASTEGLHRFDLGNWIDSGIEEGLPSLLTLNVLESGAVCAATADGAIVFNPAADTDPPRTLLNLPSKRGRNIPQGGSITMSFSGRDKWNVTPPERLLYSWRLDDRDWSPFDPATSAPFIDLPAGVHYFQVRAMDRSGNIDSQPARMEFAVILPWYKEKRSVWIACLGAAAALFFAGLAFKRHHELVLSHALVEKQVAQRTAELKLANQELLQSQKMKALGTLAAGIAHDFNNILSIIKGSTQIIEQNIGDPQKIRARADRIKTVVDQGSAVVQALLGFSRNSDDSVEVCEVNSVVENTIRLLGDRFLRETTVRFEGGPDLADVRISKGLVQQILLNFVFNAAESMPERKEVVIATTQMAKVPLGLALSPGHADAYVGVSVRDSGCGIPLDVMPRIFEPFFTTKAMSSRRGTGLGLSVAYELAQKMGAGVAVESTPGHGSVFTLILAAVPAPVPVIVS